MTFSIMTTIEYVNFWTNAVISLSFSSIELRNQGATRETVPVD